MVVRHTTPSFILLRNTMKYNSFRTLLSLTFHFLVYNNTFALNCQIWRNCGRRRSQLFAKGFATASNSNDNAKSNNRRSMSGFAGSGAKALRDAANTFDVLRAEGGKDAISDLYIRSPLNDPHLFWFVGKIARRLHEKNMAGSVLPTEADAVLSQKGVILNYAKIHLRPTNFGGPYSQHLEIFIAPGDSEMDVVQNKVVLTAVQGSANDLTPGFSVKDAGFDPEIYLGDEITQGGLRVRRSQDGKPIKPAFELNNSNNT